MFVAASRPVASRFAAPAWRAGLIILLAVWIYWPALRGGWVWDDQVDLAQNPLLRDPAGWWRIWLAPEGWHFFPLKTTAQWLQWQCWGDSTTGYHVTNLVLHLAAALLLWRLLARLGLREGWIGGLLFAVHPLAVESVAWIAELKNTLSLPLLLGAALAWIDYDEHRRARDYARSLALFAAALLAKTSVVMFPLVLWLHAWWRHGHLSWKTVRATLPFLVLAVGLGLVTVMVEHRPATALLVLPELGFWSRLAGAGGAIGFYFWHGVFPVGLAPVYAEWPLVTPPGWMFLPWLALGGVGVLCWWKRTTWGRALALGAGFFILNLVPVLGFVPMAYHHVAWVSDHFAYVSLAGVSGLMAAGAGGLKRPVAVGWSAVGVAVGLALLSRPYAAAFRGEESFWTYAVERQPLAWFAHHDLAIHLAKTGRPVEAMDHYEIAVRLKSDDVDGLNNLGNLLLAQGHVAEAIARYEQAAALRPRYPQPWANLGNALARAGREVDAVAAYAKALQIDPGHLPAFTALAEIAARAGRFDEAADRYAAAVGLAPADAVLHNNHGSVLFELHRLPEARVEFESALRLDPGYADAKANLSALLATEGSQLVRAGRAAEARERYEAALRLRPDDAGVHNNLAFALVQLGEIEAALRECERALQLRPDYPEARENLARLRALRAGK